MTTPRRTLKALAALLPLGAFGISVALAAAPAKPIAQQTDDTSAKPDVATRLAAVRTGVSQVIAAQEAYQRHLDSVEKGGNTWLSEEPGNLMRARRKAMKEMRKGSPFKMMKFGSDDDKDDDEDDDED